MGTAVPDAWSQIPRKLSYQGYLTNPATGAPINATVSMQFNIYDLAGVMPLHSETQSVPVVNGVFSVLIGLNPPLTLPFDEPYRLGIKVGGDAEMTPRQVVAASPYALGAESLGGHPPADFMLASTTITTAQIADGAVTAAKLAQNGCGTDQILKWNGSTWACASDLGSGGPVTAVTASPPLQSSGGPVPNISLASALPVANGGTGSDTLPNNGVLYGQGQTGSVTGITGDVGQVLVGTASQGPPAWSGSPALSGSLTVGGNLNFSAAAADVNVNGLRAVRWVQDPTSPTIIGGHAGNLATGGFGGVIGGGGDGFTTCVEPGVLFGTRSCANKLGGNFSTIVGGHGNFAGGSLAFVGGGESNLIAEGTTYSTIGGGWANRTGAHRTTIAGGSFNRADGFAGTVGGGNSNGASGVSGVVAGGDGNVASNTYSTIGGGFNSTSSGYGSTLSGGFQNAAGGDYSSVAGGYKNAAGGENSSVAGGYKNEASAQNSFAAGTNAKADSTGCFVWGDSSAVGDIHCSGPNSVVMRGLGGFYFATGGSDPNYSGVLVFPGAGAWSSFSDRAGKENVRTVDPRKVLRKVVAMPISTWNWKAQGARFRHMGPMAQDFHSAFRLGEDNRLISALDVDGVALAAIQGLHAMMRDKDREIARLKAKTADLDQLKRKLLAIEARLGMR